MVSFAAWASAALTLQPAPEIVVTGRGLEAPPGEAVYDVVTISRERLDLSPSNRLEDVLRDVAGFQLFRRSDARSANPTSQGATLRALGGNASSRALLTLDGVPQTDPFGGWINWPAYDPRRLGSVRVVRGGGSGTAGPGALAGTIELESAGPDDLGPVRASLAYGSRDGVDGFAGAGIRIGPGHLAATASYATGSGFVPVVPEQQGPVDRASPYEQASASLRAVAPLSSAVELQASLLAFHDARERGTAFSEIVTDGVDASLRLVGRGRWGWSALGYLQTRLFSNSFASVSADRASVARASEQYEVPSTGAGGRVEVRPPLGDVSLRVGADLRQTDGETRERFAFVGGVGTRGRIAGGRTLTVGTFVEASWDQGPLLLTAGGRVDRWWIADGRLREEVLATGALLTDRFFANRDGWEPTARGGVAWRLGRVTARAAAYLGWRLPTLNELYRPFRVGVDATAANELLEPERLRGGEVGLEWRPATGMRVSITAFANRLEDAIANVSLGNGPGTFPGVGFVAPGGTYRQRRNLEAVESGGIEVDAEVRRGTWRVTAGYSFAVAQVRATSPAAPLDGLRPAQTPRHSASLTLGWNPSEQASTSVSLRYVGDQYEDDFNRQLIPGAVTFDAAARWAIAHGVALEARAENLTDERVVAAINGDGLVERATPRTLWIGLSLRR
jgi:outer membrane receptor protein involved in Fe transport